MTESTYAIDIFLQPGEFYFGDRHTRIRTLLGSCVSIVMWHRQRLIGGMCHYVLPSRHGPADGTLDGRYAEEAMELFMREIRLARTRPEDYEVKLFGGGNMFPQHKKRAGCTDVPTKNVTAARALIERYSLKLMAENLGGEGHRHIIFDIGSGDTWMRRAETDHPNSEKVAS